MRAPRRRPTCHPDRRYAAFGLCAPCYYQQITRAGRTVTRPIKRRLQMDLVPNLGDPNVALPARPMPTRCGKCGADACGFIAHPDQPEVTCRMCGWEVLVRPRGGFTDRHLARRTLGVGAA